MTEGAPSQPGWRSVLASSALGSGADAVLLDPELEERPELAAFAGPRMRGPVFRWLPYKEAFSPGLVDAILDHWGHLDGQLCDPFAGAGTTLLAGAARGLSGVGIEMLAYPRWAANTILRSKDADSDTLLTMSKRAAEAPVAEGPVSLPVPASSWALQADVLRQLITLREALPTRDSSIEADLAHLALLTLVEPVSQAVKDGTSLRHRERHRDGHTTRPGRKNQILSAAQVIAAFRAAVDRIIEDLPTRNTVPDIGNVVGGDARSLPLARTSVGAILTSPPYPNRYDYSAVYQLELAFGSFVSSNAALRVVRKGLLRSHLEAPDVNSSALDDPAVLTILRQVAAAADRAASPSPQRGRALRMLVGYFNDMTQVLTEAHRVLRPGAPAAFVIATQTYFGEPLPTDRMLASIAVRLGFDVESLWLLRRKGVAVQQRAHGGGGRESVLLLRRRA